MKRQRSEWLADLAVTGVLLAIGIAGLAMAAGFPERARLWPMSIMIVLIAFCAVHLINILRAGQASGSDATDPPEETQ